MRRASGWMVLAMAVLLGLPSAAVAEDDAGPGFTCVPQALPIMAAEISGLRLRCAVAGAPPSDQDFTIELDQQPVDVAEAGASWLGQRTVCTGTLSGGAGACSGAIFNTASPAFGTSHFSATFLPSGTRLVDPTVAPVPDGNGTPARFDPLPEP